MKSIIIAYIPVLHQGYLNFLNHNLDGTEKIFLFNSEQIKKFRSIVKDIRGIEPELMAKVLKTLFDKPEIRLLDEVAIDEIKNSVAEIITPEDETFEPLVRNLFVNHKITTDPVFLRWDKKRSISRTDITPDEHVSSDIFDQKIMAEAHKTAKKSSDWWRQVAGILISADGEILIKACNRHVPHDYQHYSDGDPRSEFQSGENIETSTSVHAESEVVAEAAKQGIRVDGCSLYVTTFPCPVCAKLVARAGIRKVYYQEGYALLDGENVLKSAGVKIIRVTD